MDDSAQRTEKIIFSRIAFRRFNFRFQLESAAEIYEYMDYFTCMGLCKLNDQI